jgi:hypothetical protein
MTITLEDYKKLRPKHWGDDYILLFFDALTYLQTEKLGKEIVLCATKLIPGYDKDSKNDRQKKTKLIKLLIESGYLKEINSAWSYGDHIAKTYMITNNIILDKSLVSFYTKKLKYIKDSKPDYLLPIENAIKYSNSNDIKNIVTSCKYELTFTDKKTLVDYTASIIKKQMNTKITDEIKQYYKKYNIDSLLNFRYEPNISIICTPKIHSNKNLTVNEKQRVKDLKKKLEYKPSKIYEDELKSLTYISSYRIKINIFVRSINNLCLTSKREEIEFLKIPTINNIKKDRKTLLKELGLEKAISNDISASIPSFRQAQYRKTINQFEDNNNPRDIVFSKGVVDLPLSFDTEVKAFKSITLRICFETSAKSAWAHFYDSFKTTLNVKDKEKNEVAFTNLYYNIWENIIGERKDSYKEAKSLKCFLLESEVMNRIVLHLLKSGKLAVSLYDCIYCDDLSREDFINLVKMYTQEIIT